MDYSYEMVGSLVVGQPGKAKAFALLGMNEPLYGKDAALCGLANAALPAAEVEPRARAAAQALGRLFADPALARLLMFGALNWSAQWFDPGRRATLDEVADAALQLFLKEPT